MITIKEALKHIVNQDIKLQKKELKLEISLGYSLAEEIRSPLDLPSFDNSAMDGYALCGKRESYDLIGIIPTGETAQFSFQPGQALRIFTGAKVPDNTWAILMQEKAIVENSTLTINGAISEGQHIRKKGAELKKGQLVFSSGHRITAASIGVIGSLGLDKVKVFKKPKISLITSGDELISPGTERKAGQIFESNSLAIDAALKATGYSLLNKQQIKDDFELIKKGISEELIQSDVLLLSGGISVGDYDFVKRALEENGVKEIFYKVFQKPGKPLYFGRKGDQFIFALPGNPASSLTCFYIYVVPLLHRMVGFEDIGLPKIGLPLAHDYELKGDRPSFLKAKVKKGKITILDGQGSSMIHSMANGNALAFLEEPQKLKEGAIIACFMIS